MGRIIGGFSPEPLSPRRRKKNKELDEIDNFLESVMAEHGYGTAEEDEEDEGADFFDSRL